jgi:putative hydrolase
MPSNKLIPLFRFHHILNGKIPKIDFHLHTNWTDGLNSVGQMYDQAILLGLHHILYSEHARQDSGKWFKKFAKEVNALPKEPCRAFVGVEARVADFHGNLNIGDDILSCCDLVIGSVHRFCNQNGDVIDFDEVIPEHAVEIEFELSKAILNNPDVDILGHPFGMCFKKYHIAPPSNMIYHLIRKTAKKKKVFEINSKYHSNMFELIHLCISEKALFSLGSDAHSVSELGGCIFNLEQEKSE